MTLLDAKRAQAFADDDVARAYAKRPAYPPELFRVLFDLVPGRERALDLGCGPGKIALTLAGLFRGVEAVDPSSSMIEEGKRASAHANIDWIVASAEDAPLSGPYDLVTAGSSIHWMQHEIVFPKLADALEKNGTVAIISGDEVSAAPWLEEWTEFKLGWLPRVGQQPDIAGIANALRSYEPWLDIAGTRDFSYVFQQSIADFIECQHSRATWARSAMGEALASAFDADLAEMLRPHASDGLVRYELSSTLVWGRPRRTR
jgi:ubiquinone/menaquinone biosynthesis C-methylase UbiE